MSLDGEKEDTSISTPKKTVGHYSYELQKKKDEKINPIDLQREIHKGHSSDDSFENQVRIAIERGHKIYESPFYVVVLFKKERLLQNVVRQYFLPTQKCPTPQYDQVVYYCHPEKDQVEMLWVVPDIHTVHTLPLLEDALTPEQVDLLINIKKFQAGDLDKLADRLEKEKFLN